MKKSLLNRLWLTLVLLGLTASTQVINAQYFTNILSGDLLAGFRKEGANQGTNELVVYIGNVTNFIAMSAGSSITVANVNAARLTDSFANGYTNIQWSVFTANYKLNKNWNTPIGVFPPATLWYTIPRTSFSSQSTPPPRAGINFQTETATSMLSVSSGGNSISSGIATTNVDNNVVLVREPVQNVYSQWLLTTFIEESSQNVAQGDFGGQAFTYSVENTNLPPFNSTVRSDLYEVAPSPNGTNLYVDPISGSTNSAYWVGYFDFSTSGTITFTRASASAPPQQPTLTILNNNGTSTISFGASNGVTYNLIYTNLSGITAPRSNWFSLGSPIIGAGGNTNFTDSAVSAGRVYSVTAH